MRARAPATGLGSVSASLRRNPGNGETVFVEEKFVPFFKTGKELRERLNRDYPGDLTPKSDRNSRSAAIAARR